MPAKSSVRKMVVLPDHTLLAAPLGRGVVRVNPRDSGGNTGGSWPLPAVMPWKRGNCSGWVR